jgi:hypothetical protein
MGEVHRQRTFIGTDILSSQYRTYLSELLDRHQRKYKLVPMLEALR